MPRVANILERKGSVVHSTTPETMVFDALVDMDRLETGSLVVQEHGRVVGIFTERDHLRRVTLGGRDPRSTRVAEVMTAQVICVDAEASIRDAMSIMTQQRVRHLPVVRGGELCGVISIGDLVQWTVGEQQVELQYLSAYIQGTFPA